VNEDKKRTVICLIGAAMLALGSFVAWPTSSGTKSTGHRGKELFEEFQKIPLVRIGA